MILLTPTPTPTPLRGELGSWGRGDPNSVGVSWGELGSAESAQPDTGSEVRVLVSSRDQAPCPTIPSARRLAQTAEASGWRARQTYALAQLPPRHRASGEEVRPARPLATVAVRLRRGAAAYGWALWESEAGGPWRFHHAYLMRAGGTTMQRLGYRALLERIKTG